MSPRTGRPKSEHTKKYVLRIRMNEEEESRLDFCCKAEALSRSELVRKLIFEHFDRLQK